MKQVLQSLSSAETELIEPPAPQPRRSNALIETRVSLIFTGTEPMQAVSGKASLVAKARNQPDKVRQVLDKVRTDGLATPIYAVCKIGLSHASLD